MHITIKVKKKDQNVKNINNKGKKREQEVDYIAKLINISDFILI